MPEQHCGGAPRNGGAPPSASVPGTDLSGNDVSSGGASTGQAKTRWRRLRVLAGDLVGGISTARGGPPLAPTVPFRTIFGRFWVFARPHLPLIVAALMLSAGTAALAAVSIGFFKILVDRVLVPRDLVAFWWVALGYLGLTLASGLVGFARRTLSALAGERFVLDLRRVVFDRLQLLSLAFFEQRALGDIIARLTGDIKSIETLVVSGVFRAVNHLLRIVFFTAALFWLQWQLALASLVVVPFFGWLARRFAVKIKEATREQTRRSGALSAVLEESLANTVLVQAYNRERTEAARLDEQAVARFRARMTSTRLRATFAPLADLAELGGTLVVAGLGTLMLARGELTLGGLLAFAAYLTQLYSPVRRLGELANTAFAAAAGAERVLELLEAEPAVTDRPDAHRLGRARGRLEFDAVCFSYPGAEQPALHEVSFTAEPGQVIALVGTSGAGKSSLVKLALRFYDPTAGAVLLDGRDLRTLTMASVRANVAVLFQETLVLDATIAENIAYGSPGADDAAVERAARAADVHTFATALPQGYDTPVGQRGRRLSGGQRQRVAIARAMVRDAPLLILDEPTTALDTESGQRVLDPLRRLMADRTTMIISHDLVTTQDADTILVLDHGRVVERGDHESLLVAGGRYHRLFTARKAQDAPDTLESLA